MKRMKFLLTVASMFFLAGCFEINEDIDMKANGSGVYSVHTDMSQLLQAMQSYLGQDEMDKTLPSKNIYTTCIIKTLLDTAKNISTENKALIKDGYVHLKLNIAEKVF